MLKGSLRGKVHTGKSSSGNAEIFAKRDVVAYHQSQYISRSVTNVS